jgi:hypothetical protein
MSSFLEGGSSQTTTQETNQTQKVLTPEQFQAASDTQGNLMNNLLLQEYNPYQGQMVADLSGLQQQGLANLGNLPDTYGDYMQNFLQTAQQAGQGITPEDVSKWQNQYQQEVTDIADLRLLDNYRQQSKDITAQMTGAQQGGAWGTGSAAVLAQQGLRDDFELRRHENQVTGLRDGLNFARNLALQNQQLMQSGAAGMGNALATTMGQDLAMNRAILEGGGIQYGHAQAGINALMGQHADAQNWGFNKLGAVSPYLTNAINAEKGYNTFGTMNSTTEEVQKTSPFSAIAGIGLAAAGIPTGADTTIGGDIFNSIFKAKEGGKVPHVQTFDGGGPVDYGNPRANSFMDILSNIPSNISKYSLGTHVPDSYAPISEVGLLGQLGRGLYDLATPSDDTINKIRANSQKAIERAEDPTRNPIEELLLGKAKEKPIKHQPWDFGDPMAKEEVPFETQAADTLIKELDDIKGDLDLSTFSQDMNTQNSLVEDKGERIPNRQSQLLWAIASGILNSEGKSGAAALGQGLANGVDYRMKDRELDIKKSNSEAAKMQAQAIKDTNEFQVHMQPWKKDKMIAETQKLQQEVDFRNRLGPWGKSLIESTVDSQWYQIATPDQQKKMLNDAYQRADYLNKMQNTPTTGAPRTLPQNEYQQLVDKHGKTKVDELLANQGVTVLK